MSRASLDKDPRDVAAMFDDVAGKYDVTNDVLSLGQDRLWRRAVVKAVDAKPGETVLDIAAGTGTSSEPFADAGVHTVPADFSWACCAWATGAARTWGSRQRMRCGCRSPTTASTW
jgi:demethylmenaquinone methyltransferase/2-methoxy-6-polyprenyl-1,4-benzoquinol methylase